MFMGVATVGTPHQKVKYGVGGEGWGTTSTVLIVIFFFEISCFHIIGFTDIEKSPPPFRPKESAAPKPTAYKYFIVCSCGLGSAVLGVGVSSLIIIEGVSLS